MTHRHTLGILSSLTLAVAACGGGSTASSRAAESFAATAVTSAPVDAGTPTSAGGTTLRCATILTDDEQHSILGVLPTRTDERAHPGSTTCTWTYTAVDATYEDFLQVQAEANGDEYGIWTATKDSEASSDIKEPISVAGIGDESYTWVGQGDYRKLYVRRGDLTLIIRGPSTLPVLSTESTMIDLADRLFGRI